MTSPNTSTMIPPSNVRDVLPQVLPWLEKSILERGYSNWTLESLVDELLAGKKQLWAAKQGEHYLFVVTEVWEEVYGRCVHIVLGGGSLDEDRAILAHISIIEQYSKSIGAKSMTVSGRIGWKKLLASYGYRLDYATFRHTFPERMN